MMVTQGGNVHNQKQWGLLHSRQAAQWHQRFLIIIQLLEHSKPIFFWMIRFVVGISKHRKDCFLQWSHLCSPVFDVRNRLDLFTSKNYLYDQIILMKYGLIKPILWPNEDILWAHIWENEYTNKKIFDDHQAFYFHQKYLNNISASTVLG